MILCPRLEMYGLSHAPQPLPMEKELKGQISMARRHGEPARQSTPNATRR